MQRSENRQAVGVIIVAAGAVALLVRLLAEGWKVGILEEWEWGPTPLVYLPWFLWVAVALFVGLSLFLGRPGVWAQMRPVFRAVALIAIVLLVFALQCTMFNAVGNPWATPGAVIISPNATTYFSTSLEVRDLRQWLADYPELMRGLPYHVRTHPPGFVVFCLLVRKTMAVVLPEPGPYWQQLADEYRRVFGLKLSASDTAAALVIALAIALIGTGSLFPIYFLGKDFLGVEGGLFAALLAGVMPSLLLTALSPDQVLLSLTATSIWLLHVAQRRGNTAAAFTGGLLLALGSFTSFGVVALLAWLAFWFMLRLLSRNDRKRVARRAAWLTASAAAAFVLFYLLLFLGCGYRPLAVTCTALSAHHGVTTVEVARIYWKWLLMNPMETVVFAGLPLVIIGLWAFMRLFQNLDRLPLLRFLGAGLLTLLLLNLSGTVRGEVGRIWLFLFWPLALAASCWLTVQPCRALLSSAIIILQLLQVIAMRLYLTIYNL